MFGVSSHLFKGSERRVGGSHVFFFLLHPHVTFLNFNTKPQPLVQLNCSSDTDYTVYFNNICLVLAKYCLSKQFKVSYDRKSACHCGIIKVSLGGPRNQNTGVISPSSLKSAPFVNVPFFYFLLCLSSPVTLPPAD